MVARAVAVTQPPGATCDFAPGRGSALEWLNYHHLYYFWVTAREGGVARASARLHMSQPSISVQIKRLESSLDVKLFQKHGRSLVLTDVGRLVYHYAEDIFGTGRDLLTAVKTSQSGRALPLTVGVANAVPKLVVCQLLRPLLQLPSPPRLVCKEDNTAQLLADLAIHAVDVVLTDAPAPPHIRVKVFNHVLGKSDTAFFARSPKAASLKRRFPQSLHGSRTYLRSVSTYSRSRSATRMSSYRVLLIRMSLTGSVEIRLSARSEL